MAMDMFDLLPESLLFIIVSFLPFMEAARTSILSKRWLHVWHATSNIDFDELSFVNPEESEDSTLDSQRSLFLKFIDNFLDSYQQPLVDKFRLKFSDPLGFLQTTQRCVSFALHGGVRELELDFSHDDEENHKDSALFHLSKNDYDRYDNHGGTRSLETLRLFSCGFSSMADLVGSFVGLKEVAFGFIELKTRDVKDLLSTCKTLESLSLKNCWNLAHFDMGDEENLRLRSLVIEKCDFHTDYLRFKASNLRLFKYCGAVGVTEIDVNPSVMEEAYLDFSLQFEEYQFGDVLYKFLMDLYPIRVLSVCSYFLQAIPHGEEPMRTEIGLNVRHLIMKTSLDPSEFCGISFLLNSCPSLHTLTLHLVPPTVFPDYEAPYSFDAKRFWGDHAIYYECVKRSLKVVEVKGFRGSFYELVVLHYLLRCGRMLQKMNIYLLEDDDSRKLQTDRLMAKFLLTVPKASKNLKISIC